MKVGTKTKVTINNTAIFSQTPIFMVDNVIKESRIVAYFEIKNRKRMLEMLLSLEQCTIEFNHSERILKKLLNNLSSNGIEYTISNKRNPLDDNYTECEIEFFN